jgi:hypothetical protein
MPWTDKDRVNEWVAGVDLVVVPTAFDESMVDAELDLRERLIAFIAKATVDAWTTLLNTPDKVQLWAARMSAAYYLAKYQGYHLRPEIPDNPAAVLYDAVLRDIDDAKRGAIVIVDQADNPVAVTGIEVSQHTMYVHQLPVSQGGEVAG